MKKYIIHIKFVYDKTCHKQFKSRSKFEVDYGTD